MSFGTSHTLTPILESKAQGSKAGNKAAAAQYLPLVTGTHMKLEATLAP